MLPCNIIVQEHENGTVEVTAVDPAATMMAIKNDALSSTASQVREKLNKVIEIYNAIYQQLLQGTIIWNYKT